ncbi:MAG: hypothetical protein SCH70_07780 [Candidatus Methanoperedens sp.]|nr:hypothetical protein [Candidatus Methanoperedens sp.]
MGILRIEVTIFKQSTSKKRMETQKGSWCDYAGRTCQKGNCAACELYLRRNEHAVH